MSNKLAPRVHFVSTESGGEDFLAQLRRVNGDRWREWAQSDEPDPLYMSNEFGGEAGEVQNVVKKLVRESRGWKGSRATVAQLGDEIADCIICLDSLARAYNLHLPEIISAKFNATSLANGFEHRLGVAQAPSRKCGMCDDTGSKDHAGFAMEPCDHLPTPAADEVEAVAWAIHRARFPATYTAYGDYWQQLSDGGREKWFHVARAALAAMQARPGEPVQDRHELPIMRTAFRTTLSGSGKYSMQFEFRDLAALHAADCEWLTFRKDIECSTGAADAGDTSTAAAATTADPAEPAGEEPVRTACRGIDEPFGHLDR